MADARRLDELQSKKATLDKLSTGELARLAEEVLKEAEAEIDDAVKAESLLSIVPILMLAEALYSRSRYKAAIEKLKYANDWFKKAKTQSTDQIKRVSLKASISDSIEALRLVTQEKSKGSVLDIAKKKATDTAKEIKDEIQTGFVITAGIAALLLLASRNDKK